MDQIQLGSTGLRVSRACFGTMTLGGQCDEALSHRILDTAFDMGVTFYDTADVYPQTGPVGRTEEVVGTWLKKRRDDIVLATKGGRQMGDRPWDQGCSRKTILSAIDASLKRLGTDYVDLYQLHLYDPDTPIDESLAALDHLVTSGKVRYVGCSNWLAYQLALSLGRSDLRGYVRFDTVQPRYNLLHRPIERELLPLCAEQGVGVISYNPLAGGLLSSKHSLDSEPEKGGRFELSPVYRGLYWHEREFSTLDQIRTIAADLGVSVASLAVAWVLANPAVTSAIIGASKPEQLEDSLPGADVALTEEVKAELDRITEPYMAGVAI